MLRIIVIAGEQSENLATYLASSGSKVIGCYPTLIDGKGAIENSIFHADKMVYVYHPTTMDIRQDMSCLLRLVAGNFFSVREIVFIMKKDQSTQHATEYFSEAITECNKMLRQDRKQEIAAQQKVIDGELTFASIATATYGITNSNNFRNKTKTVMRYEKDSEATTAYVKHDTREHVVEPFSYESVKSYEKEKTNLSITDTGRVLTDPEEDDSLHTSNNAMFSIEGKVQTAKSKNLFMLTGERSLGKDEWACVLAASTAQAKKPILILDYSSEGTITGKLTGSLVECESVNLKTFMYGNFKQSHPICIVRPDSSEWLIKDAALQLLAGRFSTNDTAVILINTDSTEFEQMYDLVQFLVKKILYCIVPLEQYAADLKLFLDRHSDVFVLVSKPFTLKHGEEYMNLKERKAEFGHEFKVAESPAFENFNVSSVFYNKLLESD